MTSSVRDHYENLLAENYTWMFGATFSEKVREQRALLERLEPAPRGRLALDLGAGPGFQSVALADMGFERVVAVDISPTLLAELEHRKEGRPIDTVELDIVRFLQDSPAGQADAIVCMGDTLTHLSSKEEVSEMFALVKRTLVPGGVFLLTYRDLSQPLHGEARFIPVASDADKILTCFLDYQPEAVLVHDLLYERIEKQWKMRLSTYQKLRLATEYVESKLHDSGFRSVERLPSSGLATFVARL